MIGKLFLLIYIIFIFLSGCNVKHEYVVASGLKWGRYEGELNWKNAIQRCKKQGMRLPTKKELLSAYDSGKRELRCYENYCRYWSSSSYATEKDNAYVVSFYPEDDFRVYHYRKYLPFHVRCVVD
ncbi:MAG: DUF1566 domain-containing protein [Leptospiraceae bacterium]|nr:DUF1566 domain-containing protein [Leptospiraceae bacterium]MCP5497412.1 DUF1566 domain-containing protein [Leptospiraceae bacterium]